MEEDYLQYVSKQASQNAGLRRLMEALSLPTQYREVLLLHALHGLSMEEIAEALGIPEGTVKSRIHQGRRKAAELAKGRVIHEKV